MSPFDSLIGHNSGLVYFDEPERDISNQIIVQPWKRLVECLHQIPAKFLWAVIGNPKNHECCRKVKNLSLEIRYTGERADVLTLDPDLYVIRCDCGREHIRMLAAPGHLGDPANKPAVVLNPLFRGAENAKTNT